MEKTILVSETTQKLIECLKLFNGTDGILFDVINQAFTFTDKETGKIIETDPDLLAEGQAVSSAYRNYIVKVISSRILDASYNADFKEI